jgi:hypothetical protein
MSLISPPGRASPAIAAKMPIIAALLHFVGLD